MGMTTAQGQSDMNVQQSRDPLHGITLKTILNELVELLGWDQLGRSIDIRCFTYDPSISSSLKFLRKTPWAREKVEQLYLQCKTGKRRPRHEPLP